MVNICSSFCKTWVFDEHAKYQYYRTLGSLRGRFLNILLFMDMADIFVMWPEPFIQTFALPYHGGSTLDLILIGYAVSEKL